MCLEDVRFMEPPSGELSGEAVRLLNVWRNWTIMLHWPLLEETSTA